MQEVFFRSTAWVSRRKLLSWKLTFRFITGSSSCCCCSTRPLQENWLLWTEQQLFSLFDVSHAFVENLQKNSMSQFSIIHPCTHVVEEIMKRDIITWPEIKMGFMFGSLPKSGWVLSPSMQRTNFSQFPNSVASRKPLTPFKDEITWNKEKERMFAWGIFSIPWFLALSDHQMIRPEVDKGQKKTLTSRHELDWEKSRTTPPHIARRLEHELLMSGKHATGF